MRGLLRIVLASKAEHLDIEAARLENLLREMEAAEEREARSVHELETEQERLSSRTYELDAELRQTQNVLESNRARSGSRRESDHVQPRTGRADRTRARRYLSAEIEQAVRQASELNTRLAAQQEAVAALREQSIALEAGLRESAEHASASAERNQNQLESRMEELAADSRPAGGRGRAQSRPNRFRRRKWRRDTQPPKSNAPQRYSRDGATVRGFAIDRGIRRRRFSAGAEQRAANWAKRSARRNHSLPGFASAQQETSQQLEQAREDLSAERARHASIEQILRERAYTADAVQKLFNVSGRGPVPRFPRGGTACGLRRSAGRV